MDKLDILVEAKKMANYYIDHKFKYSNSGVRTTFSGAKECKKSNCSAFVCYVLQDMKLLKKGQMFYGNSKGTISYKGTGSASRVKKNFKIIKVGKKISKLKDFLKPGDICCFKDPHTNIFAGFNKEGKAVWWDAGKSSTNTKKSGGTFVKIHRSFSPSTKVTYVLRLKSK